MPTPLRVLILCTGNSCRSILGEAILNHLGGGTIRAVSAGSHPTGTVHPRSLALLREKGLPTAGLRSKSWDEFTGTALDVVITVCDDAAGEVCPIFPGGPVKVHWGLADPAKATGSEADIRAAFERTYVILEARMAALAALPLGLRGAALVTALHRIAEQAA